MSETLFDENDERGGRAIAGWWAHVGAWRGLLWPFSGLTVHDFALWVPVAFGAGVGLFFTFGPDGWLGLTTLAALLLFALAILLRRHAAFFWCLSFAGLVLAGHGAANLRTALLATPFLKAEDVGSYAVSGRVSALVPRAEGAAHLYVVVDSMAPALDGGATATATIENPADVVRNIRLRLRPEDFAKLGLDDGGEAADLDLAHLIGRRIEGTARLFPPGGPIVPGGYDFAFHSYLNGIGSTGVLTGPAPVGGYLATRTIVHHGLHGA